MCYDKRKYFCNNINFKSNTLCEEKHFNHFLTLLCLVCGLSSCSNDDNLGTLINNGDTQPDVEVSTVGQWITYEGNVTRNVSAEADEPILHFKNEEVYNRVTQELMGKSDLECMDYFKQIGFKGAFSQYVEADNELEKIFDNDDPALLQRLISEYKDKYKDRFLFNTTDTFDITPNFTPTFSAEIQDFKSSKCSGPGNATFENILLM